MIKKYILSILSLTLLFTGGIYASPYSYRPVPSRTEYLQDGVIIQYSSQEMYKAGFLTPGYINLIKFGAGQSNSCDITINISNSGGIDLPASSYARVFSAIFSVSSGLNQIDLQSYFWWNGGDITIQIVFNTQQQYSYKNTPIVMSMADDGISERMYPILAFQVNTTIPYQGAVLTPYTTPAISSGKNYIHTITPQKEMQTITIGQQSDVQEDILYFDGLGRPTQTIKIKGSPYMKDIVQCFEYDVLGREANQYLPYTATGSGEFKDIILPSTVNTFYDDEKAYTNTTFDNSPLNRVMKKFPQGNVWTNHPISFDYSTNTSDEVKRWQLDEYEELFSNSHYVANQLYKKVSTDENGNSIEEFTDKAGRMLLKRVWKADNKSDIANCLSTYYVFDDFGLLRYVIPPSANGDGGTISEDDIQKLCYKYIYDERHRNIYKHVPGMQGNIIMTYDKQDRLVLTAYPNDLNKYYYTDYDDLGRPTQTGYFSESTGIAAYEVTEGSSWRPYINFEEVLSEIFYDVYEISNPPSLPFQAVTDVVDASLVSGNVKGKITYTKVKNLSNSQFLWSVFYYDKYGRIIQTVSQNHLGGTDVISNKYDFVGKILKTVHTFSAPSLNSITTTKTFEYDQRGRLLITKHQINNQSEVVLSRNQYNERGELEQKNIHSADGGMFLQNMDYKYNIRGWLTDINDIKNPLNSLFSMQLLYDKSIPEINNGFQQYNGNISAIKWVSSNPDDYGITKAYGFSYDGINRLTNATYGEYNNDLFDATKTNRYSENGIQYDKVGNILSLNRYGRNNSGNYENIDNLVYAYSGNQLTKVTDNSASMNAYLGFADKKVQGDAYQYDAVGNQIKDANKGTTTAYNFLNLPSQITAGNNEGQWAYGYTATGTKLSYEVRNGTTRQYRCDYVGELMFTQSGTDPLKVTVQTGEGRAISTNSGAFLYEYDLKDHLGNTRVSFKPAGTNTFTDYYPFGMTFKQADKDSRFLYNGKELQQESITTAAGQTYTNNLYDYGARFYDATLGRWNSIDPMAEKYSAISPYVYCADDPVNAFDPNGGIIRYVTKDSQGNTIYFTYHNGNFYYGSYHGRYSRRYDPGNESIDNGTMYKVLSAYRKIESSGDKVLINMLHTLETSRNIHRIYMLPKNEMGSYVKTYYNDDYKCNTSDKVNLRVERGIGVSTKTFYDFTNEGKADFKNNEGIAFPDFVNILHEVQHIYDYDQGKMTDRSGSSSAKDPAEIRAVNTENRARKIEGDEKRTTYGGEQIDPTKLEK